MFLAATFCILAAYASVLSGVTEGCGRPRVGFPVASGLPQTQHCSQTHVTTKYAPIHLTQIPYTKTEAHSTGMAAYTFKHQMK